MPIARPDALAGARRLSRASALASAALTRALFGLLVLVVDVAAGGAHACTYHGGQSGVGRDGADDRAARCAADAAGQCALLGRVQVRTASQPDQERRSERSKHLAHDHPRGQRLLRVGAAAVGQGHLAAANRIRPSTAFSSAYSGLAAAQPTKSLLTWSSVGVSGGKQYIRSLVGSAAASEL